MRTLNWSPAKHFSGSLKKKINSAVFSKDELKNEMKIKLWSEFLLYAGRTLQRF